jgi:pyridoxine kinase
MARILALSSWVAAGHVGLSAATPALQRLGHEVMALPTIVLSNHKAWPACAGAPVPPGQLSAMLGALDANGWLAGLSAMLVGYLPTADHAAFAAEAIRMARARSPGLRVVVDPILGDDPKGLYLPEPAAEALAATVAPLADILTPNRFELSWLAGRPVRDEADAAAAAAALAAPLVLVTSPPFGEGVTGCLAVSAAGAEPHRAALLPASPMASATSSPR